MISTNWHFLSDIYSDIFSDILWHSIRHSTWHSIMAFYLPFYLIYILTYIYITYSDIHRAFYLDILTFYLISYLASILEFILTFIDILSLASCLSSILTFYLWPAFGYMRALHPEVASSVSPSPRPNAKVSWSLRGRRSCTFVTSCKRLHSYWKSVSLWENHLSWAIFHSYSSYVKLTRVTSRDPHLAGESTDGHLYQLEFSWAKYAPIHWQVAR